MHLSNVIIYLIQRLINWNDLIDTFYIEAS